MTTTTTIANGRHQVRTPDTKLPVLVNNHRVTADVYSFDGIQYLTVHVGGDRSFNGPIPAEITTTDDLDAFIIASAKTYANVVPMADAVITYDDKRKSDGGMISYIARADGWMIGSVFNWRGKWSSAYAEDGEWRTRKALVAAMLKRRNV